MYMNFGNVLKSVLLHVVDFFKTSLNEPTRIIAGTFGALLAVIQPTIPFILLVTGAVLFDCITAWLLARRVSKKYPEKSDGKFRSESFERIFVDLFIIYGLIIFTFFAERTILDGASLKLVNIVAGFFCVGQLWSVLENASSCNSSKWAQILQMIMVDKTKRHFNIDLNELKNKDNEQAKE